MKARETILIRGGETQRLSELIQSEFHDVRIVTEADVERGNITIVAGPVKDHELAELKALTWVHSWAAGVETEVGPALGRSGITVTSSTGNGAIPLAEHVIMLALMLNRQAQRWADAQREASWERFTHSEIFGKTMGIYGFGNVGREVASRAQALGLSVVALRRDPTRDVELVDHMYGPDEILDFARNCDILVVAAALTPETRGALDATALRALKPGAHLIVVSRAHIVQDDALLNAIVDGTLGAAGLDAHAVEPLPHNSPYWHLPQVIITPHNGATTAATAARGTEIFLDNLRRRISSRPYTNSVDVAGLA